MTAATSARPVVPVLGFVTLFSCRGCALDLTLLHVERGSPDVRRYFPDSETRGPAVILIPPMMLSVEVFDVSPAVSAVAELHGSGIDPWVVDFGEPAHEEGGLQRGLQDHLDAISESIDHVGASTGSPPHLAGYSQGGMFAYEVAVFRGNEGIASIVTLGSPVDLKAMKPAGISMETLEPAAEFLSNRVIGTRSLPSWVSSSAFELLDPAGSLRKRVDFVRRLHDRDALSPKEKQTMAKISLSGVLAERARTHPNATAFLYEGRGHTYADMNWRVDAIVLPKWYRPDPGRGGYLAFVLFSGQGDRVRARHITNERWAVSAFGTAAAASLSKADTLYGVTPHFHPAGTG